MRVLHTASQEMGQIYIPAVNWLLAIGTLGGCHRLRFIGRAGGALGSGLDRNSGQPTIRTHQRE